MSGMRKCDRQEQPEPCGKRNSRKDRRKHRKCICPSSAFVLYLLPHHKHPRDHLLVYRTARGIVCLNHDLTDSLYPAAYHGNTDIQARSYPSPCRSRHRLYGFRIGRRSLSRDPSGFLYPASYQGYYLRTGFQVHTMDLRLLTARLRRESSQSGFHRQPAPVLFFSDPDLLGDIFH